MTLAALIAAYQDAEGEGRGLRATLPLAGRTLVERQARLADAAGADSILILVERLTPELLAAIDRLRSEGVSAAIARDAMEAADAVPPDARLLLIADGLVVGSKQIARLVATNAPALLTVPDHLGDQRFERIDAQSLWAGLALLDGRTLRQTAQTLADWDLQSTLLRRAVEAGARQISLAGDGAGEQLVIAKRAQDLEEVESAIIEDASGAHGSWISRYLLAPAERLLTSLLMPSSVTPAWLYIGSAVLAGLASLFFVRGWLGGGLALLLLATPLEGTARRLSLLRMQAPEAPDWWEYAQPLLVGLAFIALGHTLSMLFGWGCLVLVIAAIAFLVALRLEVGRRDLPGAIWLAEPKGMAWLMLPFALIGNWTSGLILLACYAAGSFFWAQRQVHRRASPPIAD